MKLYAALAGALLPAAPSHANDARTIGAWQVGSENDQFNDKPDTVAVSTSGTSGGAVRCMATGRLMVGVVSLGNWDIADETAKSFKLRIDGGTVFEGKALGPSGGVVQIDAGTPEIIKALQAAKKSIAVRIETKLMSATYTYPARGAQQAIGMITKACPSL